MALLDVVLFMCVHEQPPPPIADLITGRTLSLTAFWKLIGQQLNQLDNCIPCLFTIFPHSVTYNSYSFVHPETTFFFFFN